MDEELLLELQKNSDKLVIVEGKKDLEALKKFGFKRIITLKSPLYAVVESVSEKEVLILTDLDKKGKELYGKLYRDLTRRGVRINNCLRELLFKNRISHIEGLSHLL
jgi:5S rRNA maturation endonuclease (ribonuclease M5)